MKKPRLLNVALLLVCVLFVQNSRAQDHTRWGLPEGAIARLGKGRISGNIAYSPDGTLLAVASTIGIWLYDALTGAEIALITGHEGAVLSVDFSPDGSTLVSGSTDEMIRLWDVESRQQKATLEDYEERVHSVVFSPDGKTLASICVLRPALFYPAGAWCSTQGVPRWAMALSSSSSLRITATSATLPVLPLWRSR